MFDTIKKLLGAKSDLPDGMKMFFLVVDRRIAETGWRLGQACFNTLDDLYPKWAAEIRAGEIDPYYVNAEDDPVYKNFLAFLMGKFTELDQQVLERRQLDAESASRMQEAQAAWREQKQKQDSEEAKNDS